MENQYEFHSKVLPGLVADKFKGLFTGEYDINTICARAKRVDCTSFKIEYLSAETKLAPIVGGGDIIYGLENLENKIRRTIATGNPNQITVIRTPELDKYTIHY